MRLTFTDRKAQNQSPNHRAPDSLSAVGPLDPSKLEPQTDTSPRISLSTSQDLAQPTLTSKNLDLEPSRF